MIIKITKKQIIWHTVDTYHEKGGSIISYISYSDDVLLTGTNASTR